jgi:hypothetical protein
LHPIPEGRAFRWRIDAAAAVEGLDYGRANEGEAAENWRRGLSFAGCSRVETKMRRRLVSIGRKALRGIGRPHELFTSGTAFEMS